MRLVLLDTDVMVDILRGHPPAVAWLAGLGTVAVSLPGHVHVLASPRSPSARVSELLWRIKRPVGRRAIAYLKTNSPRWLERLTRAHPDGSRERRFWQARGGYDRNIVEPATAWKIVTYLHLTPMRRGLVERPEDWEWNSAQWYAGHKPIWLEIDGMPPPVDPDR